MPGGHGKARATLFNILQLVSPLIPPVVLIFGPVDPSGTDGLPADAVTCARLGCHGLAAATALTVQDTAGIEEIHPTPPELLPYTVHPWVIANDRLRAEGWEPQSSNEEAFVASHRAGPWTTLSPRRRQELALGVSGAALIGGVAGVVTVLRRRRSRS